MEDSIQRAVGKTSDKSSTFYAQLQAAQQKSNSWLCLGIDPTSHVDTFDEVSRFCGGIIEETLDLVCAYKFNLGFWLHNGQAQADVIAYLNRVWPSIPDHIAVILDGKFGDIGHTSTQYARSSFEKVAATAVTANPYVGTDALKPFLEYRNRGLFVLCRTSNIDGNEFQTLDVGGKPLYQHVAAQMTELGEQYPGQVGLVVGATQPYDIRAVREIAPKLPFLVPGVGAQGGDLKAAVKYGETVDGIGPVINVGRAIMYASSGADFALAARAKAIEYRDKINALREQHDEQ